MEKLTYTTIKEHIEYTMPKVKWSKFIGNIFFVQDKIQTDQYIQDIQKKYPDATHHCFAYRYGIQCEKNLFGATIIHTKHSKRNDDKEPTNTAWKPILAQIEGQQLHNILIIITRYFGGTLLGVWGLIQAYSECAKQTIAHSTLIHQDIMTTIQCSYPFSAAAEIRHILSKHQAKVINEHYDNNICSTIQINEWQRKTCEQELSSIITGKITIIP